MENKSKTGGEAYAFFDCNAQIKEIRDALPLIRKNVRTPGQLEISLNYANQFELDEDTARIAKELGRKYVMKASCPNKTNKQTADETADILGQAYLSELYEQKEPFRGEVIYKSDDGEYIFRK